MKKKVLSLFMATAFILFGIMTFSCATDSDSGSGGGGSENYSLIQNIKFTASSEKIILAWQNPEQNYYGVKIAMTPAAGNLAEPKPCLKETNTFTVTSLNAGTEYTFTFTNLDSKQQDTSSKISIVAETKTAEEAADTTPPQDVSGFKVEVEDLVATLKWKVSESKDVFGYFISYKEEKLKSGAIDTSRSVLTESMPKNTVFLSPETKNYSISVKSGRSYTFTVKTVDTSGNESTGVTSEKITIQENVGPELGSRTESLNYIFGTDSVAEITLTISRKEWNKLCTNYDKNPKNEDCVHAGFEMKKGDNTWQISDIGMRLRGNTSRRRPQVGDEYYQAHFKLKFEEWCDDSGEERKLAGCMKGLNLKRFKDDPAYVREVFGYNYFRRNGIWTAPRAGYAHLFINIEEEDGTAKKLDYGVYAMIEEINKQFLKERSELLQESGTLGGGNFSNNKGELWKCCWQSSNGSSMATDYDGYRSFGVEEIFLDESKSLRYDYDLKTNKDELVRARSSFIDFIEELNKLGSEDEIKKFYESKMDVDLFLKTYACNVLLGMDDDYWRNHNNYYFYFDKNGKAYFIPYDYDNVLGTNCFSDTATRNPLDWGEGASEAPLIEKLLSVPEFKQKYVDYLLKLTEKNVFVTENQTEITRLQDLVRDLTSSKDIVYADTSGTIYDAVGSWCSNYKEGRHYKLLDGDETSNYFKAKANSVTAYCAPQNITIIFNVNTPPDIDDGRAVYINGDFESGNSSDEYKKQNALVGTILTNYYDYIGLYGYNFVGWYDKEGKFLTLIPDSLEGQNEVTVYAHWQELPKYEITRNLNGGSCKDDSSYPRTDSFYKGDWIPWSESISNGEKFFCGWYTKPDGGELVEYAIDGMTVYAHYKDLPYKYWSETTGTGESMKYLKFTFVPEDFNLSASEIDFVVPACQLNDWNENSPRMTKNEDGTYKFTYSSSEYNIAGMWYGYKFVINGVDWLGYKKYKYREYLPEKYKQTDSTDANFLIPELKK